MHNLKMVQISAATPNILKCNAVLLSALNKMSTKSGVHKFHENAEAPSKFFSPEGGITSHAEDTKTVDASVQNLVAMMTRLLGFEHLQIGQLPRPSRFFPVHHSPTSPPPSQYEMDTAI
jgi:hypothetical protein